MHARRIPSIFALLFALALPLAAQDAPLLPPATPAENPSLEPNADAAAEAPLARAAVPYLGVVTGNDVNIRSGPAEVYYDTARLQKDQQVIVLEERTGWARIAPTPQSFSYVHSDFVRILGPADAADTTTAPQQPSDTADQTAQAPSHPLLGRTVLLGVVTSDRVRVRAGSVKVPPVNANQVQAYLNEGDIIRVIGRRDDFYKIQCPPDAFFWVSLDFINRHGPLTPELRELLAAQASTNVADSATYTPDTSDSQQQRTQFQTLLDLYNAQRAKPIAQQDYQTIRARLQQLREQATAPSVRSALDAFERQLARSETALDIYQTSRRQDERLQQTLDTIQQQIDRVEAQAAVQKKPEATIISGEIQPSAVFPPESPNPRYLVVDEMGRISHYAVSGANGPDLRDYIGQQVSLLGDIEFDTFSDAKIMHVAQVNPPYTAAEDQPAKEPEPVEPQTPVIPAEQYPPPKQAD